MQKLIIAAPFGNYLHFTGATSTLGTFTLTRRAGTLGRLWRVLRTARYHRRTQSWVNRLGLPNPGIATLPPTVGGCIVSVHGFNAEEWAKLVMTADNAHPEAIELNLSCPNVEAQETLLCDIMPTIREAQADRVTLIAKLPPVRWLDLGRPLYDLGVRRFHLCNTIPTPGGGMSGKPLMQYSLWAIDDFRRTFGDTVTLIGGGGVTCLADVQTYLRAGADHVSVASMLFNPLNWSEVKQMIAMLA